MAFRTNNMPDLQEKSASGAVATFNTALAIPLVNGEFSIMAYQEGSGDPSPSNIRNIVPFTSQKITRCGKNLCNPNNVALYTVNTSADSRYGVVLKGGHSYTMNSFCTTSEYVYAVMYYSSTGTWSGINPIQNGATSTISPITLNVANGDLLYVYNGRSNGTEASTKAILANVQIEIGTTASDFELYNGNTYTVNLGEDTYGAVYNSVTGGKKTTHLTYILPTISSFSSWYDRQVVMIRPSNIIQTLQNVLNVYGDVLKATGTSTDDFACFHRYDYVNIIVPDNYTVADYNTNIAGTKIIYPLETPIDETPISPTPINTFNGNNNIFCDTGDTSLIYKDLDIAKRGSFREVFKLPS